MGNNRKLKLIKAILIAVLTVCLFRIGLAYRQYARHRYQQNELKEMTAKAAVENSGLNNTTSMVDKAIFPLTDLEDIRVAEGGVEQSDEPVMLPEYAVLYEENNDMTGWLSIPGTDIDYPVMQNEDDEYYLHHDFYGQDSKYGCLYVRKQADLEDGTNFIIYGHNMKDGAMFGDLDFYLEKNFYEEHSMIEFDTLYEERVYEIAAVFRSQVYNADDNVFKYYEFYEADTQEEFNDFYENIKELSLYDTGVEAQFGDTFITLSTCAYHITDGRLVIVAKRVE